MKYLSLELNGCKRLALTGIEHFRIDMTALLQLVLGTNGSGKSSMMEEMSPLPANHADYTKAGSKIIRIEHNEEIYTLSSHFSPKQRHSFLRGDVEQNLGGTITVQKELVKTVFGITPEIHQLLLGLKPFDSMRPPERKAWFLELCVTNYDYAIKVYNKFKDRHRDVSGALRVAKKRLVTESEKLIQSDEEAKLRQETQTLHDHLSHLMEHRKPVEKDVDTLQVQQSQIDDALLRLAKGLNALTAAQAASPACSAPLLDVRIAHADAESFKAKALIEQFSADHHRNQDKIDTLQKAEEQTISSLKETIAQLERQMHAIQQRLLVAPLAQASQAMNAFQTVKVTLSNIFVTIPSNANKLYSQEGLVKGREALASAQLKKRNLLEVLQAKKSKHQHMRVHKDKPDLQCPSCQHRFSLNYNDQEYALFTEQIASMEKTLEVTLNPEIAELEAYLVNCVQYAQLYRQFTTCITSWPILQPYWGYLTDKRTVLESPQSGSHELTAIDADLLLQMDLQILHTQLAEKQALVDMLRDVGGADLNTLLQSNHALAEMISVQTDKLQAATQDKKQASEAKQRALDIESTSAKITQFIQRKRGLNKEEIETLRRMHLNGAIRQLQSLLASREHTLNSLDMQRGVVDNISSQIFDLEQDEQALGLLVKQLSPTEGLIAEGLLGFIKNFVAEMNAFIKRVWSYPLIIQTGEVLDDVSVDLDYLFPMKVGLGGNPVPDVSKGSAGMKEIVNMAFRMIAARYLHLQNAPWVLDEFGATMDKAHKLASVYLIKQLIEQQTFSQVFMISHDYGQYGALANMQTCVLCPDNIVAPLDSNRHVTMR